MESSSLAERRLPGLVAVSWLIVVGALGQMLTLSNFEWYKYSVGFLPSTMISARYAFSWLLRVVMILTGWGVHRHKRWAVNMLIGTCFFEMLTVYWRYPYESFQRQTLVWDQLWGGMLAQLGNHEITFSSCALYSTIIARIFHIIFFGSILFYLTRPFVKKHLK